MSPDMFVVVKKLSGLLTFENYIKAKKSDCLEL